MPRPRFFVGIPGDLTARDLQRLRTAGIESDPDWRFGNVRDGLSGETLGQLEDLDEMSPVALVEAPTEDEAIRRVAEALGRPPVDFVAWRAKSGDD